MSKIGIIVGDPSVDIELVQRTIRGAQTYSETQFEYRVATTGHEPTKFDFDIIDIDFHQVDLSNYAWQECEAIFFIGFDNRDLLEETSKNLNVTLPCFEAKPSKGFLALNQTGSEWLRDESQHFFFKVSENNSSLSGLFERYHFFPYGYLFRDETVGPINEMGFRIPKDLSEYGVNRRENLKLVCLLGGSAVFSVNCFEFEMFSSRLEKRLNSYCQQHSLSTQFKVLNFGTPGCLVLNQTLHYILFVQKMNPDIVIAHDGFNDFLNGSTTDTFLLQNHAIAYAKRDHHLAEILEGSDQSEPKYEGYGEIRNYPGDIIEAYLERKGQLKQLVISSSSQFISGFQPLLIEKSQFTPSEKDALNQQFQSHRFKDVLSRMEYLIETYHRLRIKKDWHDDINFEDLLHNNDDITLFSDIAHTTPKGDALIAEKYAVGLRLKCTSNLRVKVH
ncbi:MAG: hypothetical protein ACPGN3_05240, partial [Opitutales bacterium]